MGRGDMLATVGVIGRQYPGLDREWRLSVPLNDRSGYAKRIDGPEYKKYPHRRGKPNVVKKQSIALILTCSVVLVAGPHFAQAARSSIVAEDYMIESGDPGIRLFVRNKHLAGMTHYRAEKTVLYVHGSTQAASATFDLKIDNESWMDYIAQRGYDVYLVDVRGYGRSSRPPEFAKPADDNPPVVRTEVAVRDVAAAVDSVLKRRGLHSLDLIGWSWGTAIMGRYASEHKDRVHRLVLYAPVWLHDPPNAPPTLGAYRTWTMEDARNNLLTGAPDSKTSELLPPAVFEAWSAAEIATDADGAKRSPPVVRTPNGYSADDRDFQTAGKALWDPAEITVPTLVVVGDWDGVQPPARAQAVFSKLINAPERRLVQIGEATHLVLLEKNRLQLYREVQMFLDD
jgi:pimeloyl-ACP methyl ester carboxylesterase